jgi:hypothetical protein
MSQERQGPFVRENTCPACGHHVAVSFLDRQSQPLATVAWPKSSEDAQGMKKLPLDFVRCVDCGHVYNTEFRYEEVPYSEKPNLMYNKGADWARHLDHVCDLLLQYLPEDPVVVEIGCGEGHVLRTLADKLPNARLIGFDPNASISDEGKFEARTELFVPTVHVPECKPDLVISRHVLEHLVDPLGFLQSTAFAVAWAGLETRVFIEVPCIDRAIETGRTEDFYYEHNSHFTTESFTRMLHRTSNVVEMLLHGYHREIISGLVKLGASSQSVSHAREAQLFRDNAHRATEVIVQELSEISSSGKSVAIWGGTGKAAAFINTYQVDLQRFPIVVDSDPDKAGTFVPGQGQQIRPRDYLISHQAQIIIIPMQWRSRDIVQEIKQAKISYERILIEHQGHLIDFHKDTHPY